MSACDRLIGPWEIASSGERQWPPRPSFACSKDRTGRCQLLEDRGQGHGQHLSPPQQQQRGSCGTEPSFRPSLDNVEALLLSRGDKVLSSSLSCVEEGLEVLQDVSTQRLTRPTRCRSELRPWQMESYRSLSRRGGSRQDAIDGSNN